MATDAPADSAKDGIAAQWCALFAAQGLDRDGAVIEIGPGFAPKLGTALRAYNFRGSLFVVEPHRAALESILEDYNRLLPACEVVPVERTIRDAAGAVPRNADAVLMNHLLDDLVLGAMTDEHERDVIFSAMRPGRVCSTETRAAWRRVADDGPAFRLAAATVIDQVCAFCTAVMPAWVAASQYRSWVHAHERLAFVDRLTAPLLARLAVDLAATGAYPDVDLAADRRWLVARAEAQDPLVAVPAQAITA
jgi:hypothetical protein